MNNKPGAIIIEGHVQGLSNTRALGEAGIPVYVVDKLPCIAAKSKFCQKFFICPDFQTDQFADFLIDLALDENINDWLLLPSNDHAVYTISKHKNKLIKYYKVITPGFEITYSIYNKTKLLDIAQQTNTPYPKTQVFENVNSPVKNSISFPVITKGRNGLTFYKSMGKKAFLAKDEQQLRKQLQYIHSNKQLSNSFTQELIPSDGKNKTISFTAFCVNGVIKTCWMGVKLREHPLQFGTATYAKSIYIEECYNQSVPLLKKLNYTGVCEIEYLRDPRDNKYKLIEINARTWLWVGLAKACGFNYAKMVYNHLNNIENQFITEYQIDKYWINPISDFVYSLIGIFSFRLNPIHYFNSLIFYQNINALTYKSDNKPFFAYITSIFSYLRNR